jgi:histone H3/H4
MNQLTVRPQDKLVLVVLNCAFSWGTITDKAMSQELTDGTGATKGSVRARKTLFPKGSGMLIDAVRTAVNEFYNGIHCLYTFGTGDKGRRGMPQVFYPLYMEKFGEARANAYRALNDLKEGYPGAIAEAKKLLQGAFKEDDYPPAEEIEKYLKLDVRFLPMPSGDHIMNALGAAVAADVNAHVDEMLQQMASDARKRLREAVERMGETLTKHGKIYDTMPGAINELAEVLPEIAGITGDKELQAMVEEVRHTLGGYTGDDFRGNKKVQSEVGKAAMDLLKKMGA